LNQQTALLHNTITTLHSPGGSTATSSSSAMQDNSPEAYQQRTQRQFIQQFVKSSTPSQVTTIGGQTVTHMSNGIVQIQNCDIKPQTKPIVIQEQQIQLQQNKFVRANPKGRPPKNAATIAKRLVAMSQESPVSSTSTSSLMKITKSSTPDITSSSSSHAEAVTETMVQSSFDGTEIVKFARNSTTQELIRTSMTQVVSGKATNATTTTTSSAVRKPALMKKPQTVVKNTSGNVISQSGASGGQQVVMTSNGQQFIVMPASSIQQQHHQQPQNIMLNNNVMQIQNANTNANQRLIQTSGQNGNIIIQTNNGNVLTANPFIMNNGQQLVLQNGQIIQQNNGNLKGNILVTGANGAKTIIAGNSQLASPLLGQQTVLFPNVSNMLNQSTIMHDPNVYQTTTTQPAKVIVNPEKKKGRKRKIPLTEASVQQQQQQQQTIHTSQPNILQMAPQSFQIATSPNILVGNKFGQAQQVDKYFNKILFIY
jgi:hypothetical protein